MTTPTKILIIGAGLAGTATAIRLLRCALQPCSILLLERIPDQRCGGIAYSAQGNSWSYIFNIQAGRMSAFREDVDDFLRWANDESDRSEWPEPWRSTRFEVSGPAPRRIYQDYLRDRLAGAARQARPGVELLQPRGEAVDIEELDDHALVTIRNYQADATDALVPECRLSADHVVVATGNEVGIPEYASKVVDHPRFVAHQYTASGQARIASAPKDEAVLIVGTTLTAYDSVVSLITDHGHTGPIYLVSRSGILLNTYPEEHQHAVMTVERPAFLDRPYAGVEQLKSDVLDAWQKETTRIGRRHPGMAAAVVAERITKAWEPYIPELISRMPREDVQSLLRDYATLIATHRVSAMSYATRIIERALHSAEAQVRLVQGRVTDVDAADSGLTVTVEGPEGATTLEAGLVLANFARRHDYRNTENPLWHSLVQRRGLAQPHQITGRGVEIDDIGRLVRADGVSSQRLWVVGIPREGDEIARNGRTGAFAFNVATIKNHSIGVAVGILNHIELIEPHHAVNLPPRTIDTPAAFRRWIADAIDIDGLPPIEPLIDLQLRCMALADQSERDSVHHLLETALLRCIGSIPASAPSRELVHQLRLFLRHAALSRLTDVSLTPRALRDTLGLDRAGSNGTHPLDTPLSSALESPRKSATPALVEKRMPYDALRLSSRFYTPPGRGPAGPLCRLAQNNPLTRLSASQSERRVPARAAGVYSVAGHG